MIWVSLKSGNCSYDGGYLIDHAPIKGGHVGFLAYCTKLTINDIIGKNLYKDIPLNINL